MEDHILTARAEASITSTLVSATQINVTAPSTKKQGLNGTESAAVFCKMSRPQFLAIAFYTGMHTTVRDLKELQSFLLTDVVMQQHWYQKGDYFKSKTYQQRIDGLTLSAIMYLTPREADHPSSAEIARNMGFTVSAYNKTWANRMSQLKNYLINQRNIAAQVIHKNASWHDSNQASQSASKSTPPTC